MMKYSVPAKFKHLYNTLYDNPKSPISQLLGRIPARTCRAATVESLYSNPISWHILFYWMKAEVHILSDILDIE